MIFSNFPSLALPRSGIIGISQPFSCEAPYFEKIFCNNYVRKNHATTYLKTPPSINILIYHIGGTCFVFSELPLITYPDNSACVGHH